jgi:hypothetical protein
VWRRCIASGAASMSDANIVVLGARLWLDVAKACVTAFLKTEFAGGRHGQRVEKLGTLPTAAPFVRDFPRSFIIVFRLAADQLCRTAATQIAELDSGEVWGWEVRNGVAS